MTDAFWIMLTGSLVAVTCGLLGCFLILRKMAMIGDAISHAVLPGIVIAFLLTGSLTSFPVILGAGLFGLFCTFLIEMVHKKGNLQSDASIGMVFTFLFAVGVIMVAVSSSQNVDIDQECVLYGEIAFVGFDLWQGIPKSVWVTGVSFLLVLTLIIAGYRGLFLTTFDPGYAISIGISTALWHYLLMGAVSVTTVASFESVGAILVVAFLVAPAAIAYLLTDDFRKMLLLATIAGIISAVGGYYFAVQINGSISGAMVAVLGAEFMLAFFFSPTHGLVGRYFNKATAKAEYDW